MLELNKIYNIDCIEGIKLLDNNSIDLMITSPPYNVNLSKNKYNKNPYSSLCSNCHKKRHKKGQIINNDRCIEIT